MAVTRCDCHYFTRPSLVAGVNALRRSTRVYSREGVGRGFFLPDFLAP